MDIKTVESSGQVSLALGEQYAGRQVVVDEVEPGVWSIKVGQFVADNERWLHEPGVIAKIEEGLAWTRQNPPRETNLDELEERLQGERKRQSPSRSQ